MKKYTPEEALENMKKNLDSIEKTFSQIHTGNLAHHKAQGKLLVEIQRKNYLPIIEGAIKIRKNI